MPASRHMTDLARALEIDQTINFEVFYPGNDGYGQALKGAFPFFRAHGNGRYSSSALMRLVRATEISDATRIRTTTLGPDPALPVIVMASTPFSYDDETECKSGGTVGMLVCWQQDSGRMMLAVHRARRRQKIATVLLRHYTTAQDPIVHTWVGNRNYAGQAFLLSCELYPTGLNSSGAVRYASSADTAEAADVPGGNHLYVEEQPWQF